MLYLESLPVARLGDRTAHGGTITEGSKRIYINGIPAAFVGGMHTCPLQTPGKPPVPHVGGPITTHGPMTEDRLGSIASKQLAVPYILNFTQSEAQGILSEIGLVLNSKWEKQATERIQIGKIYQQLPNKGQAIKPGGKIDAWVYYTEVPAVVETPVDKAMSAITAAWFKPQKGKEIEVENEAKWNTVATQSLEAVKKVFQADLPVTLDVYVKPKKKESNSHPLVGQWQGYVKQGAHPKESVLWNIISVSPSGKFNVVGTDHAGKKDKFHGMLKGNQINLTDIKGALRTVLNATWNKKTMTMQGTVIPYFNGKNMMADANSDAGTKFSIILFLEKK